MLITNVITTTKIPQIVVVKIFDFKLSQNSDFCPRFFQQLIQIFKEDVHSKNEENVQTIYYRSSTADLNFINNRFNH